VTKREREEIRRALRCLWEEDDPDEGYTILARLAGYTSPLETLRGALTVSLLDLPKGDWERWPPDPASLPLPGGEEQS
jgi:hypothetical protein